MGPTARYQETLRRLAMIDEGFVEDEPGLGPALAGIWTLEPKTAAFGYDVGAALKYPDYP